MTIAPELLTNLVTSTEEVFETMVFKPLARLPVLEGQVGKIPSNVVATVAFAGHRRGLVAVHSTMAGARAIAGSMLGMPPDSLNGEVPDAIGEIANMIAGTFRNRLATIEPASAIAVPTVTVGSDFQTTYLSAVRRAVCPFEMDGQPVSVELVLTGDE
jgi:chemotaxis protein CheX